MDLGLFTYKVYYRFISVQAYALFIVSLRVFNVIVEMIDPTSYFSIATIVAAINVSNANNSVIQAALVVLSDFSFIVFYFHLHCH